MSLMHKLEEKKIKRFKKKHKIGLCLSGGGARGFSYIGAFKVFEDAGIEFDMVAGTSAGSIFGAMYACKMNYEDMFVKTNGVKNKDFKNSRLGFLPSSMEGLGNLVKQVLPMKRIEDFAIPYYAVAVDIKTGKEIVFDEGEAVSVITGSCAIPGVFTPVKYKNMTLIDGGVKNNIPADVLREKGCDFVVTIDCNSTRGGGTNSNNFFNQFTTSIGIMMVNNSRAGLELSDVVIRPNMKKYSSLKIVEKDEMIKEGYRATLASLPEILNIFMGKVKKRRFNKRK